MRERRTKPSAVLADRRQARTAVSRETTVYVSTHSYSSTVEVVRRCEGSEYLVRRDGFERRTVAAVTVIFDVAPETAARRALDISVDSTAAHVAVKQLTLSAVSRRALGSHGQGGACARRLITRLHPQTVATELGAIQPSLSSFLLLGGPRGPARSRSGRVERIEIERREADGLLTFAACVLGHASLYCGAYAPQQSSDFS